MYHSFGKVRYDVVFEDDRWRWDINLVVLPYG